MALSPKDLFSQDEFWILLFFLGAVLFNWPILSLAIGRMSAASIPTVLAYISAVWILIIAILYWFDRGSES
ncbi:MAG: hypothetical protein HPY61_04180 [Methanotrichaceae archaeon]|nr:hypothetical protein [Methanotrichaceae archaeon]